MPKSILLTGATDGIGLATAQTLVAQGHTVLIHGRNAAMLSEVQKTLTALPGAGSVESFVADLSRLAEVEALAKAVSSQHQRLDVLINNAGVLKTPHTRTPEDLDALAGRTRLGDMPAYAQSKLAITMWSRQMAIALGDQGPVVVAVNPGSLLATKMVKVGFGMAGSDIRIGADILVRAALSDDFARATGQYFDNDAGRFTQPHPDALDSRKTAQVVQAIEALLRGQA